MVVNKDIIHIPCTLNHQCCIKTERNLSPYRPSLIFFPISTLFLQNKKKLSHKKMIICEKRPKKVKNILLNDKRKREQEIKLLFDICQICSSISNIPFSRLRGGTQKYTALAVPHISGTRSNYRSSKKKRQFLFRCHYLKIN